MAESTLRGAGRNASGPLIATWQMLEWIRDNGPADRDTIIASCSRFVDVGYARRWYVKYMQGSHDKRNPKTRITGSQIGSVIPPSDLAHIPEGVAQRAVIVWLLRQSTRRGAGALLRIDDLSRYHYLRMPTRTPAGLSVEAVTSDERILKRHVYAKELVKQLRAANQRGAFTTGQNSPRLLRKERDALFRWLSTFDDLDGQTKIELTGIELEAILALRAMRERQAGKSVPRETNAERLALRALWLTLDNFATESDALH